MFGQQMIETEIRRHLRTLNGVAGFTHDYDLHLRLARNGFEVRCWCVEGEMVRRGEGGPKLMTWAEHVRRRRMEVN